MNQKKTTLCMSCYWSFADHVTHGAVLKCQHPQHQDKNRPNDLGLDCGVYRCTGYRYKSGTDAPTQAEVLEGLCTR